MNDWKDQNDSAESEFIKQYDPTAYERFSLSVDTVIFSVDSANTTSNYRKLDEQKLTVLLVKRGEHPYLGCWSLPGGFVRIQETLDEAAARILKSKTGLSDLYIEQLFTFGNPNRDPRMRIISCAYLALIDRAKFKLQQENASISATEWFEIELTKTALRLSCSEESFDMPIEKTTEQRGKIMLEQYRIAGDSSFAFDHAGIILEGLLRLRGKIRYTDIVFNMMPERFSIADLQQVYEIILGKKLLAPAFRRTIASKIVETGEYTKDKGHRPSQLFVYRH